MPFHRQRLRRWAARVLLLWLFGVGAGVANACLVAGSGGSDGSAAAHHTHVGAAHHHAAAGEGAHDQDTAPAVSNCQDFCDKASVSLPSLKPAPGDVQGQAWLVSAVPVVLAAPVLASAQPWLPRRDGLRAPPIPIAFLRLAL
jgi:hypothetical protein